MAITRLGDLAEILSGVPVSRHASVEGVPWPVINISDLHEARILDSPHNFTKVRFSEKVNLDRHRVHAGDVLLACRGSGFRASVAKQLGDVVANANLLILRPIPNIILPEFLLGWLESPPGQRELLSRRRGVTMMALSQKDVGALQIPVPPLDAQRVLADLIIQTELGHRAAIESAALRRELGYAIFSESLLPDDKKRHARITKANA